MSSIFGSLLSLVCMEGCANMLPMLNCCTMMCSGVSRSCLIQQFLVWLNYFVLYIVESTLDVSSG